MSRYVRMGIFIAATILGLTGCRKVIAKMILTNPDMIDKVAFHPRPEDTAPRNGRYVGVPVDQDVEVGSYLFAADTNRHDLVIMFHGNGELAAEYADLAPMYNRMGVHLWVVDFRGYGRSTGTPSMRTICTDADKVFAYVPTLVSAAGLDIKRTFVMGRSLGSTPALHLGARHSDALAGLIIESGFAYGARLVERLAGGSVSVDKLPDWWVDNIENARKVTAPTLLIHGTRDEIIPYSDAQATLKALPAESKRLVSIEGGGHNTLLMVGSREYFTALAAFFKGP